MKKKQPRYPVKEMVTYRLGDMICQHPICSKPFEEYVRQAREIWGDQYDYYENKYTYGKKPVTIHCRKHDYDFTVGMAQNHLMKHNATGCPICKYEQMYGVNYGAEWQTYLEPTPNQCRVRLRKEYQKKKKLEKTPEQIAAEKAERESKAEAKRREEQAYIERWSAKNLKEAHFKERVFQMYGDQYDMALVDYQNNDKDVTLICRHHGIFEIKPRILLVGISHGTTKKPPHGCWKCCGLPDPHEKHVMTAKEFNQKIRRIYHSKPLTFPIRKKISLSAKVTATCAKHGKITHDAQWWLDGKGCEYCNDKWYAPNWKEYARAVHGEKYEYVGEPPKTQNDYIHYICPKHGLQEQKYQVHVLQGCGCPKCANYPNKKTPQQRCDEWIAKCIEKYGEGRYDYSRAHEDYKNNDSLVWIRCCIHDHWFQQTPDNNLRTVNGSCPICSIELRESKGEAEIRRWLLKHGITNFKQDEVTLPVEDPRCKRQYLRPDFWLPDYNLFIEYNGEQHYEDIEHFHDGYWTLGDQQIRDEAMRKYCRDNGHRLLEIPYWDFHRINEILTSELLNDNINELTNRSVNP